VWRASNLWPLSTSIIGIYEEPPPDVAGVDAIRIEKGTPLTDDFFNAQGLKTARAATRLKDWVKDRLPG